MHSFQKTMVRMIAIFLICVIIESGARPLSQQETGERVGLASRLMERQHDRTSARKRHAEIRLNSEIAKVLEDLKRVKLINGIMNQLDNNRINIQVKPNFPHRHSHEFYHIPVNSNVQMRIIPNNVPQKAPVNALQYKTYAENTVNALALAETCRDMQRYMGRLNIRIKITCSSSPYRG